MDINTVAKGMLYGSYFESCASGKTQFTKAKAFYTTPKAGDIVFFYTSGKIGHTGIVSSVDSKNKKFNTIEGNTSSTEFTRNGGCVYTHSYSYANVGGTNRVNGFGRPKYGSDTCTATQLINTAKGEIGYLEKKSNSQLDNKTANAGYNNYTKYGEWCGDNGEYWCAQFVSWCFYQTIKTLNPSYNHKQFIKDCQKALGYSKTNGIADSGLLAKTITVSATKNRKHAVVKPIQKYFNSIGYNCGTEDCIAGTKFTSATKAFQKANKCVQDGEITAKCTTWKKLLKLS